jgi:hypothetical protein
LIRAEIFINFGGDDVKSYRVKVAEGSSVLDALLSIAHVEFTPNDIATGHNGSVVTSIETARSTMNHFWLYYVSTRDNPGWKIPMHTPDSLKVEDEMRIAWRYHDAPSITSRRKYGPRFTSRCMSKASTCNRGF